MTKIEWTDRVWNPLRGCTRVSPGCQHCYAERMCSRGLPELKSPTTGENFAIRKSDGAHWTGKVELIESALDKPLHWRKPSRIFVNSMSDLFHESVPNEWIDRIFAVMALCPKHVFQVLTKRAERMFRYMNGGSPEMIDLALFGMDIPQRPEFQWPLPNVWLGVSCEDQQRANERIPWLLKTPAAVRFVSIEPMLSSIDLSRFIHDEKRSGLSGTSGDGVVLNSRGREHLEKRRVFGRGDSHDALDSSSTRGVQSVSGMRISEDHVSPSRRTPPSGSASDRVDPCEPTTDSVSDGNQPQRWKQEQSEPGKSGTGHTIRKCEAFDSCPGEEEKIATRRNECCRQNDGEASRGNQGSMGCGGDVATGSGETLRTHAERHFGNRYAEELEARRLDLVIVGGESGPGARPMHPEWARSIRNQCIATGVPFFFKQWGAWNPIARTDGYHESPFGYHVDSKLGFARAKKKASVALLDGREWKQFPWSAA